MRSTRSGLDALHLVLLDQGAAGEQHVAVLCQ